MQGDKRVLIRRLAYTAYLGVGVLASTEGVLRVFVSSDPAYYVAFSDTAPGTVVQYPYGEIRYNTDGFADDEFDTEKTRPRVGYLGDSVCFGVGAGHGYRVSEVVERAYPAYEHMNFTGGLGGGTAEVGEKAVRFSSEYDLDAVVYMMNLNDIYPEKKQAGLKQLQQNPLFNAIEWFRGRSYLYTYVRQILKDLRNPGGGPPSYEMFPDEHGSVISGTAERVSRIGAELDAAGVRFIVLIVPYEMQVSDEAAGVYKVAGTVWERAFLMGATQDLLEQHLVNGVVVDGLKGFLGPERDPARRAEYAVGEAFVYNLGERLDWNHPNRLGHKLLGEQLVASGALDGLGD